MTNNLISWTQAPSVRQSLGLSDNSNNSFNVSFGSTPVNGNLLIGVIGLNTGITPTPPTGFSRLDNNADTYVYTKTAASGTNTFSWTYGGSKKTDECSIVMIEVQLMNASTPIQTHASTDATNTSPSVTTIRANDLIILVWVSDGNPNFGGTVPTGYVSITSTGQTTVSATAAQKVLGTGGATGTAVWGETDGGCTTIAIRGI